MKRIHRCILTRVIIPGHGERDSGEEEELPTPQRLTHLLDSWAPGSSLLWIRGTLSLALLPLGSGTQHQDLSKRGKCWGDIRQRGEMTVSKPLRRSWMCNCPPQVQWPSHQAPSWPAGCWHRGNQWQGPSGPPWPSPPPDTLMLTAYSSGKGEHNCRSTMLTVPAYACACVCVMSPECTYLQVFGSFFIAGHEHKLCTDAAEMHVAQNCCTLYCCFVCWLQRK